MSDKYKNVEKCINVYITVSQFFHNFFSNFQRLNKIRKVQKV